MGEVGDVVVCESIGGKQVTELVVGIWLRNPEYRYESGANRDDAKAYEEHGKAPAPRQSGEHTLNPSERARLAAAGNGSRREKNQGSRSCQKEKFKKRENP